MGKSDCLGFSGKFIFWSLQGKWDTFMPQNRKIPTFHIISSLNFSHIMYDDRYSKRKGRAFFQGNFEYVQSSPLWAFLGTKLTRSKFLVSLLEPAVHCYFVLGFIPNLNWMIDISSYGNKRFTRRNFS